MSDRGRVLDLTPRRTGGSAGPTFAQQPGRAQRPGGPGVLGAYFAGWAGALTMPGVVVLLWIVNVSLAVVITLPFARAIYAQVAHSAMGDTAFHRLGVDTFLEFVVGRNAELHSAAVAVAPVVLLALLIGLYLSGGVMTRLWAGHPQGWGGFFAACNRHVWRLLAVGVLVLLFGAALLGPPLYWLGPLVTKWTKDGATPMPAFYLTWAYWVFLLLLGSVVARVYDYSRLLAVAETGRHPLLAFAGGVGFTLRYSIRTFLLWFALTLTPLVFVALHAKITAAIGLDSDADVWLALAAGQVLILLRIAGRLAVLSGQMHLLMHSRR